MRIVRTPSGDLMIRTDAGADLCRRDQNWKLHVPMFVRDTDALYRARRPIDQFLIRANRCRQIS